MKKKLLAAALLLICLSLAAGRTWAYFTQTETAHNVITSGEVNIELLEWADEEKTTPFADLSGVLPGAAVTKIVEVENTGSAAAWVRVKLETAITPAEDDPDFEPDDALLTLDIDTARWQDGGDGYLYYQTPLQPGETTDPVFTAVSFAEDMGNEYQGATVTVDVTVYAVQSANNGTAVADAQGWPT